MGGYLRLFQRTNVQDVIDTCVRRNRNCPGCPYRVRLYSGNACLFRGEPDEWDEDEIDDEYGEWDD